MASAGPSVLLNSPHRQARQRNRRRGGTGRTTRLPCTSGRRVRRHHRRHPPAQHHGVHRPVRRTRWRARPPRDAPHLLARRRPPPRPWLPRRRHRRRTTRGRRHDPGLVWLRTHQVRHLYIQHAWTLPLWVLDEVLALLSRTGATLWLVGPPQAGRSSPLMSATPSCSTSEAGPSKGAAIVSTVRSRPQRSNVGRPTPPQRRQNWR